MRKIEKQNLWFLAGLFGIGVILIWRCFYSLNTTDEAFYVGTVYRFWYGDGVLSDEWMPTQQMCSFWIYPFYVLFRMILGSNDGMILAFRILYVVFQLVISGYLYGKLRRFGYHSFLAVFFYLLSTAFNINSLSYNTMANSAWIALLVTLVMMETPDWKNCIICGIFASILVMANPYAVAAYVLYGIACVIVTLVGKRKNKEVPVCIRFCTFFRMSLTAAAVFVVFLIFVFRNSTLESIINNLPHIIGDQEHVQRWDVKFSDYFRYFRKYYLGCMLVPTLASAIALVDKKRTAHGKIYMGFTAAAVFVYMVYRGLISDYVPINLVTVPICMLGLTAYIVAEKKLKKIFFAWYVPALVYPFIVQITSNTGPLAVSAAFMTAGAASLLLTASWVKEQNVKGVKIIYYGIMLFQLVMMLYLRITYVWGDDELSKLTARTERGAAKWIYTTEENAEYFEGIYDDIDELNLKEDDGFLVIGSEPLLYLYADKRVASYSTWLVYTNENRLYRYYEVESGRFPSVVYCENADETIFDSAFVEKLLIPMGYEWKQMDHGIAFYTPR